MKIAIVYESNDDGWWTAWIAEVPGAISQGRTREEAKENAMDALKEILAANAQREMEGDFSADTEIVSFSETT